MMTLPELHIFNTSLLTHAYTDILKQLMVHHNYYDCYLNSVTIEY